ncbi:MAG: hypothetical protein PHO66_09020 [Eubacteriales bacterium]|nr:hypothetical protein [Eubacteriales bacterium]
MRKIISIVLTVLLCAGAFALAGCKTQNSSDPAAAGESQSATLAATWELYEPYGAWKDVMELRSDGTMMLGDMGGKWSSSGAHLTLKTDDNQVFVFTYVINGYQLMLENSVMGIQLSFIAPDVFVNGASDSLVCNKWLDSQGVNYIELTAAGEYNASDIDATYELKSTYFARDGILRVYNADSQLHEYYGYTLGDENTVLNLLEVGISGGAEYSYYSRRPNTDFAGSWNSIASSDEGELPDSIVLNEDGTGNIVGGSNQSFTWEAFGGGTMNVRDTQGNELDFSFDIWGGTMYVSNEVGGTALMVCDDHIDDINGDAEFITGSWKSEDGTFSMQLDAQNNITLSMPGAGGEAKTITGTARYGGEVLMIRTDYGAEYYLYQLDGDTLNLSQASSAFDDVQASWSLIKQS